MSLHDLLRDIITHIPFPDERRRRELLAKVAEHERDQAAAGPAPAPAPAMAAGPAPASPPASAPPVAASVFQPAGPAGPGSPEGM